MLKYSQRDPRWSNIKIKNSNRTIGLYGCALTAVGNAVGLTPLEVMAMCDMPNGLVDWWKVKANGWQFNYRSNNFERARLREIIPQSDKFKVLLCVKNRNSPTGAHWVTADSLWVGGYNSVDPYPLRQPLDKAMDKFYLIWDVIRHVEFIKK